MLEALAHLGVQVLGVDASPASIAATPLDAASQGATANYRLCEPNEFTSPQERFDVVQHVSDVPTFLATPASCLARGGVLFTLTINRAFKSLLVAIIGAEYQLLRLPRGTHQSSMFVRRPEELSNALTCTGLQRSGLRGMRYMPLLHRASWCRSKRVNHIAAITHGATRNRQPRRKLCIV